ncbi:MAG: aspartate-semialdehyde dehydrogenase [Phycisphaerales bacterium]|nr:aspartate-semialdehyde dehydrogenase [Planctomycetota bacterium]MCH8509410.1 aspartate-semialdehyde dehydrogenase [Phycisphaerales bacterium]
MPAKAPAPKDPVRPPLVAVVGATGAVGREALSILAERGHPADRIIALASARSAGERLPYADAAVTVAALTDDFPACDAALFCATADIARAHAPGAVAAGALVVDNSSAFRMDPAVPLVVPEINASAIADARLIANPNCSTIILLTALNPLRERFGVARIVVSTYQAVSGAGLEAVAELQAQTRAVLDGRPAEPSVFPEPCAFNVFSHESPLDPATGLNGEESKMIAESRRIWNDPGLILIPTCVRVPVLRAHTQSALVTLENPATEDDLRAALAAAPGVALLDDRAHNRFPTPLGATGGDPVLAGRIRRFSPTEFSLLIAGDQLRKGAALNAVQIMDLLT